MNAEHDHGLTDEQFAALTRAVRDADQVHQSTGGGTRHWLRECFLPALEDEGLRVTARELE